MIKAFHMLVSYGVQKSSQQSAQCLAWPKSILNFQKRGRIGRFLMHTADIGFLHTVAQVLDFKGIGKVFTHGWWQRFCHWHKEISLQ